MTTILADEMAGRRTLGDRWRAAEPIALGGLAVITFFLVWEVYGRSGIAVRILIRPPSEVFEAGWTLISSGQLLPDLRASALVFVLGMLAAMLVAIPLGFLAGWYRPLYFFLEPYLTVLYATPRIALIPLLLIWFGVGIELRLLIVALSAFFPLVLNVIAGVRTLERDVVTLGRSFGAHGWFLFRSIVIPGSVPFLVTGLRFAAARGLVGTIVAELYAANEGIGFFMIKAGNLYRIADLFFAVLMVAFFGLLINYGFDRLERTANKWRPAIGSAVG